MELNRSKPKMLLHCCCGPCSTSVIERLEEDYALTAFFYNPNISDPGEYDRRLMAMTMFLERYPSKEPIGLLAGDWELDVFNAAVRGLGSEPEGGARCAQCFRLRLAKTAEAARAGGFDCFCTTLTVSPRKNAALINQIGTEEAARRQVSYIASDFKKKDGYRRSVELSKQYGLYRQGYCGCTYSKNKE